ncbi:hypothetical protein [Bdellovibrio bacteriovorus]|uniref:hypothetical protein n=1 Tax=Bdellovibrio TaxID=958 RepID=UPI0035A96B09
MGTSILEDFKQHRQPSPDGEAFLNQLEKSMAQDLWQSAGGSWSQASIDQFRAIAARKLASTVTGDSTEAYQQAWVEVVRDFHLSHWGEVRLLKKEKRPQTESQRIFWELFSYIWILVQAALVMKVVIFYFGIKSAREDTTEGKIYVLLAILFSFISLSWFAYRKSKSKHNKD